ncbi:hypothetical protein BJ138DRAFT_1146468 [Hygrophoropsis aurantiaca]|uniref:Uncharacterized protein n=1 Tax=Hygrophoropsis aurantiaca TaxID=72124 RepID=A0ACB8AJX4_9AGAM|nr:hypothetical protein BJ138DRAFT_1146468 [Hygrophoropsis aurantiaca]
MASTATFTYCPPPTSHTLDAAQRTRLMRSTRKLGAVLGTTPYLLEDDMPLTCTILPIGPGADAKKLKRQGSIFTHTQTQSVTSFNSTTSSSIYSHNSSPSIVSLPNSFGHSSESLIVPPGLNPSSRKTKNQNRPLYLRLNTVPVSPSDSRFAPSLPSTPSPHEPSNASVFPPTPCTPSFTQPSAAEIRRKRMAKLARHLGENVPTELVFPAGASSQKPEEKRRNRRSMSLSVDHVNLNAHSAAAPPPAKKQDWVGEWNRNDIRDVQRELRNLRVR